jgi:Tol biopolymer transport system component
LRFDLETVDEFGALPERLAGGGVTKRPLLESFAASWSPDGSKLVFSGLAGGGGDRGQRGFRLYVVRADDSGLRSLPGTQGADEPVFAPDGVTVAFTRYQFRPRINRRGERKFVARGASIWLTNLTGGVPRRITPERNGLYMWASSFSPDGGTLLADRAVGTRRSEAVGLRLGSGNINLLLRNAFDPVYSPDGSRIALIREHRLKHPNGTDAVTSDLFTIRAGGGRLRRLTYGREDDYYPSWDPSGERLAFVRYPPEVTELDELGFGSAVMEVNSDGTCLRSVLPASPATALFGAAWEPGVGRGAGRIVC